MTDGPHLREKRGRHVAFLCAPDLACCVPNERCSAAQQKAWSPEASEGLNVLPLPGGERSAELGVRPAIYASWCGASIELLLVRLRSKQH